MNFGSSSEIKMPNVKIKFRKIFRWILPLAFILAAFLLVRLFVITRGYESAVGKYITTGGQSYLVIKKGFFRSLDIDEGFFILNEAHLSRPSHSLKVSVKFRHNQLIIFQKEHYDPLNIIIPIPGLEDLFVPVVEKYKSVMVLEASRNIPGDWDMVDLKMRETEGGPRLFFYSVFWSRLFGSKSFAGVTKSFSKAIRSREILKFELDPAKAPIRSFFHRLEDPQMLEYFRARFRETPSKKTLGLIRKLVSQHPTDSWLLHHELEQEALHGDVEKAEILWKKWKEENKSCPDSLLLKNAQFVSWIISTRRLYKNYPELTHYNDAFTTPSQKSSTDLEHEKKWLLRLFDSSQIIYPEYPLVPHILSPEYRDSYVPNFLNLQVRAKSCMIESIMDLFLGKRDENFRLLSGIYLLGGSLRMNAYLISTLIGAAMQNIAVNGLTICALNACETKEDFEKFHSILEKLNRVNKVPMEPGNPYYNSIPSILSFTKASGEDLPNYLEAHIRIQTTDTRFQLLRMAISAKYHLITTGDFPNSGNDFAPFLPKGLPEDGFSKGDPLRFKKPSDDEFLVYSIGPDKKDDSATFTYDPTNGTLSDGDVYIRIPREREFPFPREGVRAANAYKLLEQFPNGLPADPFADTRYRPFSIIESTETQPVVIFSFGTDTDEADFKPYVSGDPGSSGDIFVPVPTPAPPPNASYGRSLQWVMRRSDRDPPPPGSWTLEPMYDPTNGIVSSGNLFLEIPR